MRKTIALILVLMLISPTAALAAKTATEENTLNYTLPLLGYTIVVVPATEDSPATIGIFKTNEAGEPEKEITSFTLGGILGSSVSTLAQAVAPGPGHGQVVSAFVRTVNQERRKVKRAEIEKRKEEKRKEIEERKAERERLREQKREEKQETKEEHQQSGEQNKGKGKAKGRGQSQGKSNQ